MASAVLVLIFKHRNVDAHDIFLPRFQVTSCFGAISAVLSAASDMPALAMTKFLFAASIPASTFLRSCHIFTYQIQELTHQLIALIF